jgi:hypothetical protein
MNATNTLDRWGTLGLLLTALLSPCCFPLFAVMATGLGLGSFELFGGWTMWVFQALVVISIVGLVLSYRKHRSAHPLLIGVPSALVVFLGYHFSDDPANFLYAGMLGLMVAAGMNYYRNRSYGDRATSGTYNGKAVELRNTIKCPFCGHMKVEMMPTDACVYFYDCERCKTVLKPKPSDCCVYCSYGAIKCPPMQVGEQCC